jgi:hypothetical protein
MSDTGTRLSPERLFRYQAAGCRLPESPSPFYAVLLDALADDCAAGNTSVIGLMDQTPCTVEAAPALRLLGGVQRCVLDGAASQLAAAWPAEGASGDTAVAHDALVALCADPPPALRAALECDPQTNEVGRAAALAPGLAEITRRTGLPIRLLEIGASAALLSRLDHFRYEATNARWGDAASKVRFDYDAALPFDTAPVIVERHACDLRPIDATTADGAQRLLSYCWPDQTVRRNRLRAALEIAAALPVTIDAASADDWLDEHLRPLDALSPCSCTRSCGSTCPIRCSNASSSCCANEVLRPLRAPRSLAWRSSRRPKWCTPRCRARSGPAVNGPCSPKAATTAPQSPGSADLCVV